MLNDVGYQFLDRCLGVELDVLVGVDRLKLLFRESLQLAFRCVESGLDHTLPLNGGVLGVRGG